MQEEIKKILQLLITDNFTKIETTNDQLQKFLQPLGLPGSI
jgi:hypothetical protein